MDFQIHRYPATTKRIDPVIVANFPQEEADAIEDANAWGKMCIQSISAWRGFLDDITKNRVTFRHFIKPGIMMENFDPSYADTFQEKFRNKYVTEAYNNLLPIVTAYRRKMHREHERQRDQFMNLTEPLQIPHVPQLTIIPHDQRYLPSS